jgi:hypothetical protein
VRVAGTFSNQRARGLGVLVVAAPLLGACMAVSNEERQELAVWDACTEAGIAARRNPDGSFRVNGRMMFFEVAYECRAKFPDWDQAGKTKRGAKLLTRLYNRIGYRGGPEDK